MKIRSNAPEIMDDLQMEGPVLRKTLKTLARINALLGGDNVSVKGVKHLVRRKDRIGNLHLIDLGCGEGSQLRVLADFSRKLKLNWRFTGVDANADCIAFAKERSQSYPEIEYLQQDVFNWEMPDCDMVLATLFMHHFDDQQIIEMINSSVDKVSYGWIINDLQRSRIAYGLFWLLGLFIRNKMVRHDGLLSIKKGFKKEELFTLSEKIQMQPEVSWNWAFRYLWTLKK